MGDAANGRNGERHMIPARLSALWVTLALACCAVALAGGYVLSKPFEHGCAERACQELVRWLDLDQEANLPTWFSTTLWLFAGAIAGAVGAEESKWRWHWFALAALCGFMSLDEASQFHEIFGTMLGDQVSANRFLFYNWIFYGLAMVLAAGAVFLPFLRAIPRSTALRFVLAGAVFVSGAVGLEMIGAASKTGAISLVQGRLWIAQVAVEESLEMAGVILLIRALLLYQKERGRAAIV